MAWCDKVNHKVHATTNEIPFERLPREKLQPMKREYIVDNINLRRVGKDCLISYSQNKYSVQSEYVGMDVTVIALDNMLAVYSNGKQIALHKLSYNKRDMIINKEHYRKMIIRQSFNTENTLLHYPDNMDINIGINDLSVYDDIGGEI